MSNQVIKPLGEILQFHRGYDLPAAKRIDGGFPIISSSGFSGFNNDYKCDGENVVTGRYGTIGEIYYYCGKCWPLNTALYVSDFKGNFPKYIYYLLKQVLKVDGTDKSTVPGVDRNVLHLLKVPFYEDLQYQHRVTSVLQAIDDKIENNNKINDNLQQQAKLLYDYWFTQFDFPDGNGKPYRSSGGKMKWSDDLHRNIPYGWNVKQLKNLCPIVLGGTPDTTNEAYWNGDINWLNSGEVAQFPVVASELKITNEGMNNSPAKLMKKGSVVVSITGNIRSSILAIDTCANQSVVGIMETNKYQNSYTYQFITRLLSYYTSISTGNCQKHINKGTIEDSVIVEPSGKVLMQYYHTCSPLYNQIYQCTLENQQLISLRDWLSPMLMNGQATIND